MDLLEQINDLPPELRAKMCRHNYQTRLNERKRMGENGVGLGAQRAFGSFVSVYVPYFFTEGWSFEQENPTV